MRLLYLGEITTNSMFVDLLIASGRYQRVDHFIKSTLDYVHMGMNPQPDAIVIKCDWENNELEWAKRYSAEIPKLFIVCDECLENKCLEYRKLGHIYSIDAAIKLGDLKFISLLTLIDKYDEHLSEHKGDWDEEIS